MGKVHDGLTPPAPRRWVCLLEKKKKMVLYGSLRVVFCTFSSHTVYKSFDVRSTHVRPLEEGSDCQVGREMCPPLPPQNLNGLYSGVPRRNKKISPYWFNNIKSIREENSSTPSNSAPKIPPRNVFPPLLWSSANVKIFSTPEATICAFLRDVC